MYLTAIIDKQTVVLVPISSCTYIHAISGKRPPRNGKKEPITLGNLKVLLMLELTFVYHSIMTGS